MLRRWQFVEHADWSGVINGRDAGCAAVTRAWVEAGEGPGRSSNCVQDGAGCANGNRNGPDLAKCPDLGGVAVGVGTCLSAVGAERQLLA